MINIDKLKSNSQKQRDKLISYHKKKICKVWKKGIRKNARKGLFEYQYTLSINSYDEIKIVACVQAIKDFETYGFRVYRFGKCNEEIKISWAK